MRKNVRKILVPKQQKCECKKKKTSIHYFPKALLSLKTFISQYFNISITQRILKFLNVPCQIFKSYSHYFARKLKFNGSNSALFRKNFFDFSFLILVKNVKRRVWNLFCIITLSSSSWFRITFNRIFFLEKETFTKAKKKLLRQRNNSEGGKYAQENAKARWIA